MDWFFDEWIYKMGHPVFDVSESYDDAGKQLKLSVKQVQEIDPNNEYPQTRFFQTFVDIEIGTPSGARVERVWIKPQAENVFTFAVDGKPNLVNFDYEGTLLKELRFVKSFDELVFKIKHDRDVLGRNWAMNQIAASAANPNAPLAAGERERVLSALRDFVATEKMWQLRRAALGDPVMPRNAGNRRTPSKRALLKAIEEPGGKW